MAEPRGTPTDIREGRLDVAGSTRDLDTDRLTARRFGDEAENTENSSAIRVRRQEGGIDSMTEDPPKKTSS